MAKRTRYTELVLAGLICFLSMLSINMIGIVSICFIIFFMLKTRGKIYKIKYISCLLYLFIAGFVLGIINNNPFYDVIRDSLYYLIPIATLYLGAVLYTLYNRLNPLKVFVETVTMEILIHLFQMAGNFATIANFSQLREYFMFLTFSVPIALLILLDNNLSRKLKVTKNIRVTFLLVIGLYFVMSLSRISYIMFISIFILDVYLHMVHRSFKFGLILRVFIILVFFALGIFLMPEGTRIVFFNKITNIFTEIKTNQNWNVITITQDWRDYERYVGDQLFESGTFLQKLFGFGFGKLIPVLYSQLVGVSVAAGGITLLHDGYRTVLIKCGIVGLIAYFTFFVLILFKKNKKRISEENFVLKYIALEMLIGTSVVVGFFSRAPELALLLLMGFYLKKSYN